MEALDDACARIGQLSRAVDCLRQLATVASEMQLEIGRQVRVLQRAFAGRETVPAATGECLMTVREVSRELDGCLEETMRFINRSLQPLGDAQLSLRAMADDLTEAAFKTTFGKPKRFSVREMFWRRLVSDWRNRCRSVVVGEVDNINAVVRSIEEHSGFDSESLRLNSEETWSEIENLFLLEPDKAIDLQPLVFFDLLAAGRQKVFTVLMLGGCLGKIAFSTEAMNNVKDTAGGWAETLAGLTALAMLALFVGSVVTAWRKHKTDQEECIVEFIAKQQKKFLADGGRVLREAASERQRFYKKHFERLKRAFAVENESSSARVDLVNIQRGGNERGVRLPGRLDFLKGIADTVNECASQLESTLESGRQLLAGDHVLSSTETIETHVAKPNAIKRPQGRTTPETRRLSFAERLAMKDRKPN